MPMCQCTHTTFCKPTVAQSVPVLAHQIPVHCTVCIIKLVSASVRVRLRWPALADQMPRTQGYRNNVTLLVCIGVKMYNIVQQRCCTDTNLTRNIPPKTCLIIGPISWYWVGNLLPNYTCGCEHVKCVAFVDNILSTLILNQYHWYNRTSSSHCVNHTENPPCWLKNWSGSKKTWQKNCIPRMVDNNIMGPNFFDPKLTWPKLFQTERTRLTHLLSFASFFFWLPSCSPVCPICAKLDIFHLNHTNLTFSESPYRSLPTDKFVNSLMNRQLSWQINFMLS